jgi:hypothetical protein
MNKAAKTKAISNKQKSKEEVKSRATTFAEDIILGGTESDATKDEIVILLCGKPPAGRFFRVHPNMRADVRILKVKEGTTEERYIVARSVAGKIDYVKPHTAFLCTTLAGIPFLWLVSTNYDTWSSSARKAAVEGMTRWIRLVSNNQAGTYKMRVAKETDQEPNFQELDKKEFIDLLKMAFDESHIITDMSHPIAKEWSSGE